MTVHTDDNDFQYYLTLDEAKADGYAPVKCNSVLQFFELEGRKVVMNKDSVVPIADLKYMVLAKYPGGDRHFLRTYHNYSLDQLFWYRRSNTFSGDDTAVESLRRYVDDGRVTLLLDKDRVTQTSEMLRRIYKAQFKTEGQLDYRIYLKLLELNLKYEDYKGYAKEIIGFKTVCNQYEGAINELWKQAMK